MVGGGAKERTLLSKEGNTIKCGKAIGTGKGKAAWQRDTAMLVREINCQSPFISASPTFVTTDNLKQIFFYSFFFFLSLSENDDETLSKISTRQCQTGMENLY